MSSFQNLLVHVSGSDAPAGRAALLARGQGARITLIDVLAPPDGRIRNLAPDDHVRAVVRRREEHALHLAGVARRFESAGVDVRTRLVDGPLASTLLAEVERGGHDLLLKAVDVGMNQDRTVLGVVDEHLLRRAALCPVWLLRSRAASHRVVLVAVDAVPGDARRASLNRDLLALGRRAADALDGELHVVYVAPPGTAEPSALDGLLAASGVVVPAARVHKVFGHPARRLREVAASTAADTLVLGTLAQAGDERLAVGRTAEEVLATAPCSVLALSPAHRAVALAL